jgi:hypothetical protein
MLNRSVFESSPASSENRLCGGRGVLTVDGWDVGLDQLRGRSAH